MNWQPLGDRILVKRDKAEEKTEGGIVQPEVALEAPTVGTIVAVGQSVEVLRPGHRVQFPATSGYDRLAGGIPDDHIVMREDEVMLVLIEEPCFPRF